MSFPGQQEQQPPINGSHMNMTPNQFAPSNGHQSGSSTSPHDTESIGNNLLSQSRGSANMFSPVYGLQFEQYSQQQMSPVSQFFPSIPSNSQPPPYSLGHNYSLLQGGLYHPYAPVVARSATTPQNYYQGNFPQPALSTHFQASTRIDFRGVVPENGPANRQPQPFSGLMQSPSMDSFSPQLPYSPPQLPYSSPQLPHSSPQLPHSSPQLPHSSPHPGENILFPSPSPARPSQAQRGIPMRTRLENYQESARKDKLANKGLETSRRSARQRKPAQHFGHSGPNTELEELDLKPQETAATVPAATKPRQSVRLAAHHEKKRSRALVEDNDEFEADTASSSKAAPKRSRLSQAAPVPQATPRLRVSAAAKVAVKSEEDGRPEPRGQPEVWAEVRQALCESLPYYQAYHSAAYTKGTEGGKGGFCYGLLLDNDNDERGYMDEKSIITRTAGCFGLNLTTGEHEQMGDQNSSSSRVTIFSNNQRERIPIVVIVGAKNAHCPTRVPHRYNVLGHFHVTDSWSEKVKGKTVCRIRLEMIDLRRPSWWGVRDSVVPTRTPDYTTKAATKVCNTCGITSKQRYAQWMCLNEECKNFSTLDGKAISNPPAYNPAFIAERSQWPRGIKAPLRLKPAPPLTALLSHPEMETSLSAWKGMVCPACGRCNSRSEWDQFKCETPGCQYEIPIQHTAVHYSALAPTNGFEAEGHAICFNKWDEPMVRRDDEFIGYWRKATYEVWPGNYIAHFMTNLVINRQPGGADDILEALQKEKLGMKRHALKSSAIEGEMLTRHFGANYGLPYKFVAAPDSKGFSEAPPVILDALNHLTWAGQDAVRDGSYRPFNELLCLGYMESQSISYHDDGEKDLGPDIASLSLGGAATMNFRIKARYYLANKSLNTPETYNPELPVIPGSQAWKQRIKANDYYKAGRGKEYEAAKKELFTFLNKDSEKRKKNAPVCLSLELRHGDMVVMHGAKIQEIYEHGVQPKPQSKLRYGLTGRYVKPENIAPEEHWKGEFSIPEGKRYEGDLEVFERNEGGSEEEDEYDA